MTCSFTFLPLCFAAFQTKQALVYTADKLGVKSTPIYSNRSKISPAFCGTRGNHITIPQTSLAAIKHYTPSQFFLCSHLSQRSPFKVQFYNIHFAVSIGSADNRQITYFSSTSGFQEMYPVCTLHNTHAKGRGLAEERQWRSGHINTSHT